MFLDLVSENIGYFWILVPVFFENAVLKPVQYIYSAEYPS
jgi:hypothetical protein